MQPLAIVISDLCGCVRRRSLREEHERRPCGHADAHGEAPSRGGSSPGHTSRRQSGTALGLARAAARELVVGMDEREEQLERERARQHARRMAEKEAQRQAIEHKQRWKATRTMLEKEAAKYEAAERPVRGDLEEQERRIRQWRASAQRSNSTSARPYQQRGMPAVVRPARSPRPPRSPRSTRTHQAQSTALAKSTSPFRLPRSPEPGAQRPPSDRPSNTAAAVVIQACARGYVTRQTLTPERTRRENAATALQAVVRGEQLRRRQAAAVKVQSAFRGWKSREQYYDSLERIVASEQIQAAFRGWQVRSALVAEAEALMADENMHGKDGVRTPELNTQAEQPVPETEQVALERVRRGLLARGPKDVADALAAMAILQNRLDELSLHYDRSA